MSKVKAIQHRDEEKIGFTEPYPAIQFSGSYNDIIDIIGMIGVENLDFPKELVEYWNQNGKFSDHILEKYCDKESNFTLPGKLNKEAYPPEKLVIRPRDWVVLKTDLLNNFYVDVVDHRHVMANYEVVDWHKDTSTKSKNKKSER
jgi:hypothetical protein